MGSSPALAVRQDLHRLSELVLPQPQSVRAARVFATSIVHDWRISPDLIDDIVMMASELATNAVTALEKAGLPHPIRFVADLTGGWFRFGVWDCDPGFPAPRAAKANEEGGRGLALVAPLDFRLEVYAQKSDCDRCASSSCRGKLVSVSRRITLQTD